MTQRAIDGFFVYFVTTNTTYRQPFFDSLEKAILFGNILRDMCSRYDFVLFGYCVIPDHIHFIVHRKGIITLSKLLNDVKGNFSRLMPPGRFWQPRYNFRIIFNDIRFGHTIEYIRFNYTKLELPAWYGEHPWVFIDWASINDYYQPTVRPTARP